MAGQGIPDPRDFSVLSGLANIRILCDFAIQGFKISAASTLFLPFPICFLTQAVSYCASAFQLVS